MKTEKHPVKYFFTNDEIIDLAKTLSELTQNFNELDEARKNIASQYKAQMDQVKAGVDKTSRKISNGYEYRDKDCILSASFDGRMIEYIDPDTGEKVFERLMLPDEAQEELSLDE